MQRTVLAVAVALILAGCTSEAPAPVEDDFGDLPVNVAPDRGIVRGVVIDASIRPVADVTVTLVGIDAQRTTDDQGRFLFDGLEPGPVFIRAEKAGFHPVQQNTEVQAGVPDPPILKLLLEPDPENAPYVMPFLFRGFIECSVTAVVVGYAACSELPTANDKFSEEHTLDRRPDFVQSEMVWDSTQPFGSELAVMYSWNCGGAFLCDHEAAGQSPLLLQADEEAITQIGLSEEQPLFIRVFNRGLEETQVEGTWGIGSTLNQEFTVFTHVFYNTLPPEGWRFTEDGDPPYTI